MKIIKAKDTNFQTIETTHKLMCDACNKQASLIRVFICSFNDGYIEFTFNICEVCATAFVDMCMTKHTSLGKNHVSTYNNKGMPTYCFCVDDDGLDNILKFCGLKYKEG